MNSLPVFSSGLMYLPLRLGGYSWARRFLIRQSGGSEQPFCYSPDLEKLPRRLLILPDEVAEFSTFLPLILHLGEETSKGELLILSSQEHRPILKALQMEDYCLFHQPEHLRYGEAALRQIRDQICSKTWDICLFLDGAQPLVKLYLARCSKAPYRVALQAEEQNPFVNISLRPRTPRSLYSRCACLYNHFRLNSKSLLNKCREYSSHRLRTGGSQDSHSHLSSNNVLLLNMEPSRNSGRMWTEQELVSLSHWLGGKYRLLALFQGSAPAQWSQILEQLQIRVAPIPSTSGALVDLVRQYRALVSLDSAHAHLAMHLTETRVLLLQDGATEDREEIIKNFPQICLLDRAVMPPAETSDNILTKH